MDVLYMAPDLTEDEDSLLIVQVVDAQERLTASAGELSAARRDFETVDAWVAKQIDEGSFVGPVATAGVLRLQQRVSILDEAQDAYDNDKEKLEGIIKRQQQQASIKTAVRKLSGNSFLGSLPAFTVAGRLRAYIEPTPKFESGLLRRYLGPNITASAVNELHETRTNLRAAAYISGSPGRGKTLCELLLLLATLPQYQKQLLPGLAADQVAWWQKMPIFVASFNGLTKVSIMDHLLAAIDPSLPVKLRVIFTESHDPAGADFFAYCNRVVDSFESGGLTVAGVDAAVAALMNVRLSAGAPGEVRAVLLVDELPKLSLSTLTVSETKRCSERLAQLRAAIGAPREAISAIANQVPATADDVFEISAASAISKAAGSSSYDTGSTAGTTGVSHGAKAAAPEQARLLSGGEGVAAEAAGASTAASLGAVEVDGGCLDWLATLFEALETSEDGDVFFIKLLEVVSPERLSVARESINILTQNPLVMAVGLLNFKAPTTGIISERLSWDYAIGQAALFLEDGKRPTIIVSFFFAALQARLKQLARFAPCPEDAAPPTSSRARFDCSDSDVAEAPSSLNDPVVGTIHDVSGDDCGIYSASGGACTGIDAVVELDRNHGEAAPRFTAARTTAAVAASPPALFGPSAESPLLLPKEDLVNLLCGSGVAPTGLYIDDLVGDVDVSGRTMKIDGLTDWASAHPLLPLTLCADLGCGGPH
ncbi:hypothetical protein I4F81_011091 [Pyropia yezoensis]|uniref:Uncharacterized protein n=1 Tax=Pyropia yezoensis TaxID=2788 RepID=A0ACC3CEC0_PYRYE|nr:hypothetical protein I4F81_011091 [Neopyropia yezoensis]